jgi:hypothetical protein
LVVNVHERWSSIDDLVNFCNNHQINGVTNGEILLISEMSFPPVYLERLVEEVFEPKGFKYGRDMIILEEQLATGVEGRSKLPFNGKIFGSEQVPWLGTEVRTDGNYVWKV